MMDRIITYLRQPWLVTLRRSVALLLVSVSLWYLAAAMRGWESDLYGGTMYHVPVAIISICGCILVPVVACTILGLRWWKQRRNAAQPDAVAEEAPRKRASLWLRMWDIWVLLVALAVCLPLRYAYEKLAESRSTMTISCQGIHGEGAFAYVNWVSPEAKAEGVRELQPAAHPYLHSFRLPDGDFRVGCKSGPASFELSHIRRTRRFTLKPHFDIKGQVDLYISPIRTEEDRRRTHTLLNYYMENPRASRPRIKRTDFSLCENAAVLYLDYGEYVMLPVPKGGDPKEAPALIYISLKP